MPAHAQGQTADFRQAPGDERGQRVTAESQAVAYAGTDCDHVFHRPTHLDAHRVRAGIEAKCRTGKRTLNGLGQVAALATLAELPYYRANFKKIIATSEKLSRDLRALGFEVLPSQTNFILVRPPRFSAETWLQKLREQKVLVRWFKSPQVRDYLRITIGTPDEAATLLKAARQILDSNV